MKIAHSKGWIEFFGKIGTKLISSVRGGTFNKKWF